METMKNINSNQDTNILTEQLGEGMRHTHRLELELKRLRQENEDLKLDKFHADANKMLALETENKKLSLTIQQLQVCLTYLDTICINICVCIQYTYILYICQTLLGNLLYHINP